MKKIFLAFSLLTFIGFACTSTESSEEVQEDAIASEYACPMECEGDKSYSEAGKCPTCKMDLVLADDGLNGHGKEGGKDHEGHDHDKHEGHNH